MLSGVVVGLLERDDAARSPDSLAHRLVPLLAARGARVRVVDAREGAHRLDRRPGWDVTVLKSGSAEALHLAAAASAFGIPAVNDPAATRVAQDRLASAAILTRAGLPVPPSRLGWLEPQAPGAAAVAARGDGWPLVVKSARGSQGNGVWMLDGRGDDALLADLPAGPYLVMDRVAHTGEDLKVFVAGEWMRAIRRVFPARTGAEKRGRSVEIPPDVADAVRRAGALLGLRCYGCDFVDSTDGWQLVDVNAFPGYKGADGAAEAIADELERTLCGAPT